LPSVDKEDRGEEEVRPDAGLGMLAVDRVFLNERFLAGEARELELLQAMQPRSAAQQAVKRLGTEALGDIILIV
jgi:hypothetical protein